MPSCLMTVATLVALLLAIPGRPDGQPALNLVPMQVTFPPKQNRKLPQKLKQRSI